MNAYDRAATAIERERFEQWLDARALLERREPYLKNYSLRRAINDMALDRRVGSLEREVSADLERTHRAERGGIIVPFAVFAQSMTRADIVGTLSAGGYLAETVNLDAADALRPSTVAFQLGATYVPAPYGAAVNLPRQTGVGTAQWLTAETTSITESDQTFGQVAGTPRTIGAYTELSRLLTLQAAPSPAEFVVRRDLVATVGRALDLAAFFGTGVAGQPHGLAGLAGVNTFTNTSATVSTIIGAAVALGDGLDASAGVATTKAVAGLLRERQEFSGSTKTLWQGSLIEGTCCDFPARSSSQLTAGSFFIGSFDYLNIVVWGEGVEVVSNPYGDSVNSPTNFAKGIIGVRAFLTADIVVTYPTAFAYASSTT